MYFQTPGEKIKEIRKLLGIRQSDLENIGVTRNFISMVEGNRRRLGEEQARVMFQIFLKKADELGLTLDIDCDYLSTSPKKAALIYCSKKLLEDLSNDEIDYILKISLEYSLHQIQAEAYILKANRVFDKGIYKEAFVYYYNALDLYNEIKEHDKNAFLYNKLGKCKGNTLDYLEALKYFEKSYQNALDIGDISTQNNSLYNIALCNKKLGNIENALKSINEVIDVFYKENDFTNFISAIIIKANCLLAIKEYQQAIDLYNEIIPVFTDETHCLLGYVYHNLGLIYLEKGMLEEALLCYNRAITIRELSNPSKLARTQIEKAKVFMKFKMYEQATNMTKNAIETAKQYNDTEFIIDGYYQLEKIYDETNRLDLMEEVYLNLIELLEGIDKKDDKIKIYIKLSLLTKYDPYKYEEYLKKAVDL
ncbi:helix-turn-helix transcriptional regulator [Clostridium swellfunianum]|uniref:helix-turn-helix domain-containing protein n=1 Tax=Clostridium swellfunianum TaxID=1367462 RepID=UPI00202E8E78|nr:tetratricopeptide repeat protein [Clostridium swellfunianum]MCM0647900.1 helix-turn-helix transcriptional regulator [Clostridium swellfunianum]